VQIARSPVRLHCRLVRGRFKHSGTPSSADYHEQYETGAFLEALRVTRIRQAKAILPRVRLHAPKATRLLDFGCERGWFLLFFEILIMDAADRYAWCACGKGSGCASPSFVSIRITGHAGSNSHRRMLNLDDAGYW